MTSRSTCLADFYGVAVALMLVVLPALTGMFWALALMLRLLASLRP